MVCVAEPANVELCRRRGDSFADQFTLTDVDGTAIDITGFSFLLTVDTREFPDDVSTQVYQLTGTITNPTGGVVEFAPSAVQSDVTPSTYYYDIQQTDAGSLIRTIVVGEYVITQDITK